MTSTVYCLSVRRYSVIYSSVVCALDPMEFVEIFNHQFEKTQMSVSVVLTP